MQHLARALGSTTSILRCPVCTAALSETDRFLTCGACACAYAFKDGIAHLYGKIDDSDDLREMAAMVDSMSRTQTIQDSGLAREALFRLPHRRHSLALQMSERKSLLSVLERISRLGQPRILNISCGIGRESQILLDFGMQELHLLDISEPAVRYASRLLARFYPDRKLYFYIADVESLPFVDNAFDMVFVYSSAHHYRDIRNFLNEALRVAREVILCSEPAHMGILQPVIDAIGWNTEYGEIDTARIHTPSLESFARERRISFHRERIWQYFPKSLDRLGNNNLFVGFWFILLNLLDRLTPESIRHSVTLFFERDNGTHED